MRRGLLDERLLLRGEGAGADFLGVGADGGDDDLGEVGVLLGVLRDEVGVEAEEVVPDLHLAVALRAGADADGRDVELLGDDARDVDGHRLEDDGVGAGFLQGHGVVQQADGGGGRLALHLVAAELVDRLRRQAEVAHHRDAGLDEQAHRLGDARAALQLDGLRAALLEHAAGVAQGVGGAGLVAHERHVGDDVRLAGGADDGLHVVQHLVHGHGDRGVVAEDDVAEAVADEDERDAGLFDEAGGRVVVGGDHDDLLAASLHRLEVGDRCSLFHFASLVAVRLGGSMPVRPTHVGGCSMLNAPTIE